jgi:hypothetical protein
MFKSFKRAWIWLECCTVDTTLFFFFKRWFFFFFRTMIASISWVGSLGDCSWYQCNKFSRPIYRLLPFVSHFVSLECILWHDVFLTHYFNIHTPVYCTADIILDSCKRLMDVQRTVQLFHLHTPIQLYKECKSKKLLSFVYILFFKH